MYVRNLTFPPQVSDTIRPSLQSPNQPAEIRSKEDKDKYNEYIEFLFNPEKQIQFFLNIVDVLNYNEIDPMSAYIDSAKSSLEKFLEKGLNIEKTSKKTPKKANGSH